MPDEQITIFISEHEDFRLIQYLILKRKYQKLELSFLEPQMENIEKSYFLGSLIGGI